MNRRKGEDEIFEDACFGKLYAQLSTCGLSARPETMFIVTPVHDEYCVLPDCLLSGLSAFCPA